MIILISSCEKIDLNNNNDVHCNVNHKIQIDARLPNDSNGYYHLILDMGNWQTLHRISGIVDSVQNDWELTKVYWSSSHYWIIGDTLGYIIHFNNPFNDNYYYQTPDTTYITFFDGFEVPTINSASYSTMDGEINTMFAPVQNMQGDTVTVFAQAVYEDGCVSDEINIKIILE